MTEKEFNLSEKIWREKADSPFILTKDVKEFIKINWKNQCHFIWDLVEIIKERYKLDISDLWTEKQIKGLKEKQDKLAGEKLSK